MSQILGSKQSTTQLIINLLVNLIENVKTIMISQWNIFGVFFSIARLNFVTCFILAIDRIEIHSFFLLKVASLSLILN